MEGVDFRAILGHITMKIRVLATIFAAAIAASGCTSLQQEPASAGAMGSPGDSGIGGKEAQMSADQFPDAREDLLDPGPF